MLCTGLALHCSEAKRIKDLLVQRAMLSGTEWSASGESELAALLYDCKLGLTSDGRRPSQKKAIGEKKAWKLLRKFGMK